MPVIPNLEVQSQDGSFTLRSVDRFTMAVVLAAGVAKIIDVPVDTASNKRANMVFFAPEAGFFASYTPEGSGDVAAAIPIVDNLLGSAPDYNPTTRKCRGITKIGLISRTDQVVTLTFYQ